MPTSGKLHLPEEQVCAAQDNTATHTPDSAGRPLRKAGVEQGSQLILTGTEKKLPRLGQQRVTRELMSG